MDAKNHEYDARCELAAAHRLAVMDGLNEGTWNHLSLMSEDNPEHMFISPGDTHWSRVTASNLAVMGPQNEQIAGPRKPNGAAWIIHYPVHRARPDAKCLMHIHAPYSTALGLRENGRLNTRSSQAAAYFHDDIAYFDTYDGVLAEESEGDRMAAMLGDKRVLMMRNHGVLVAGPTVGDAYTSLYLLERACMFQVLANTSDDTLNLIPEDVAEKIGEYARRGDRGHFDGMKEVLEHKEPDYVN